MNPNKLREYVKITLIVGAISGGVGYFTSRYIHTPTSAWNTDINRDGIEDIVIESMGGRAVLFGISDSTKKDKDFVSGEKASQIFNSRWRKEYKEYWGEEPDRDKCHLKTKWEIW